MIDNVLAADLAEARIIAVITIENPQRAVPLAKALVAGGVHAMELTLRTAGAIDALKAIVDAVPEMIAGVGTVLTVDQLRQVKEAGARLGVAPGFNREVVQAAADMGFPFAPGVMTPSEIEGAVAMGNRILKFYHAGVAGGLAGLKAMAGPYNHLGLRYIPLGGVSQENVAQWLADPMILAAGGSWIAPPALIDAAAWDEITARARAASAGNGGR